MKYSYSTDTIAIIYNRKTTMLVVKTQSIIEWKQYKNIKLAKSHCGN